MKDAKTSKHAAPPAKKHILRWVILALLLVVVLAAGTLALLFRREIKGGGASGQTVTVEVAQGSGVAAIARQLQEAGVIHFPRLFRWYVGQQGAASKLQYGTFELEQGASYDDLIASLSVYAAADSVRLTFPEGTTAIAIANQMEQAGLCSAKEFLEEANQGDFSEFAFWQYVPTDEEAPGRFLKCEGYLFPDTYEFLEDGTVHDYVATFYARFDQMITDDIYQALEQQGMTLHQLITLASFVQEEAGNDQDSNVAQVFRNRLAEGSPYPRLESNVSSHVKSDEDNNYLWNWVAPWFGGWDEIPQEIIDAYDTYQRNGLPAGPVSNPGIDAIRAALDPQPDDEAKDAYFFVTDKTGHYYYAQTLSQHQANIQTARQVNAGLEQ